MSVLGVAPSGDDGREARCLDSLCTLGAGNHAEHYDSRDGVRWENLMYEPSPLQQADPKPAEDEDPRDRRDRWLVAAVAANPYGYEQYEGTQAIVDALIAVAEAEAGSRYTESMLQQHWHTEQRRADAAEGRLAAIQADAEASRTVLTELNELACQLVDTRSYLTNTEFHAAVRAILMASSPARLEGRRRAAFEASGSAGGVVDG